MGQKIHPGGLRVGVIHDWKSNWYTGTKEFPQYILEDVRIREHIYKKLAHAGLSDILIRKDKQRITVDIYTARPGIVIGKSGVEVDALRQELHAMTQKNVHININEIKRPELDAKLVAQSIAEQLSNRVAFRRAMKRALALAIRSGAAGVKIQCSGRLGGGEMSRRETYNEGRVPLHTIRADIDYGFVEARTAPAASASRSGSTRARSCRRASRASRGGEQRLGDQDARRRRGGATEGLGASRESGRGRSQDREGLGPVKRRRGPGAAAVPAAARRRRPAVRRPRAAALPAARRRRAAGGAGRARVGTPASTAGSRIGREPSAESRRRVDDDAETPKTDAADADDAPKTDAPRGPKELSLMLMPKKTKFRKVHRGRRRGETKGQSTVQFGDYGLKAMDRGWITNRQIEAARIAMTRKIKRGGKVWINVFPDKSVHEEARRDPHGLRQGLARGLGRRDQARARDVRARRRAGAAREGSAPARRPEAVGEDEGRDERG